MFIQSRVEEEWSDSDRNKVEGYIQVIAGRTVVLKDTDQDYGLLLYLYYDGRSF